MCRLLKKHFYKPLKMLYRYKSKWYMPPKIKYKYGLSKAKLLQKDFKRINKVNRIKLLKKNPISVSNPKSLIFSITAKAIPTLIKQKPNFPLKKKYIRTKFTKVKFNLKKKKRTIKKYLNKVLKENLDLGNKAKKISNIVNTAHLLNKFEMKTRAMTHLSYIKRIVLQKDGNKRFLKKRLINSYTLASKYFLNYSLLQNNILTTTVLLKRNKKLKKTHLMLNFLKIKQSLLSFKLKEKESFVYNDDILDSNFLETNLREIWGITPAKSLTDYFLAKSTKINLIPLYRMVLQKQKKSLQFRLKKKTKYKKNYDKMYYKKRRINFEERSYNRLGINDVKKKTLKMKRRPFSLLHLQQKRPGILLNLKALKENLINNSKLISKKSKRKILFLNPSSLLQKLHQLSLTKNKYLLRPFIKTKFKSFVRLLKLEIKKNSKKIKKFTKKILFYKKQKSLLYRKKKIETLNLREYFIRENHKLREEIKHYRYTWKNSPFFNYNKVKQNKLNLIIELRKQKHNFNKIMKKYPEGIAALKERVKRSQYYTGLSLLKRKLEQGFSFLDLSAFIRACTLPFNTSFIFGQQQVKWVFAGPKRTNPICSTKL